MLDQVAGALLAYTERKYPPFALTFTAWLAAVFDLSFVFTRDSYPLSTGTIIVSILANIAFVVLVAWIVLQGSTYAKSKTSALVHIGIGLMIGCFAAALSYLYE